MTLLAGTAVGRLDSPPPTLIDAVNGSPDPLPECRGRPSETISCLFIADARNVPADRRSSVVLPGMSSHQVPPGTGHKEETDDGPGTAAP